MQRDVLSVHAAYLIHRQPVLGLKSLGLLPLHVTVQSPRDVTGVAAR
jgi:hypothetical protein